MHCLQDTCAKHHHLQQLASCVLQLVQYIFILSMDRKSTEAEDCMELLISIHPI